MLARLRDRGPVLLVLDNLEHLLGAASVLNVLLDELSELRILVTSQAPLRLSRERCLPVDALDPEASLTLIERVAPGGERSSQSSGRTVRHCSRSPGCSTGCRWAWNWRQLAWGCSRQSSCSSGCAARRTFSGIAGTTRPERQRSLRATVQWTLGLIAPEAQALFVRMGAFVGPVPLEEIEAVAGADGLDVLEALSEPTRGCARTPGRVSAMV